MDCRHHRALRIWNRAWIDLEGRPEGAAPVEAGHGGWESRGVHHRWSTRAGAGGPTWSGMAGEGDRQPGAAVPPRSRPALDGKELGSDSDSEAVRDGGAGDGRADRGRSSR